MKRSRMKELESNLPRLSRFCKEAIPPPRNAFLTAVVYLNLDTCISKP